MSVLPRSAPAGHRHCLLPLSRHPHLCRDDPQRAPRDHTSTLTCSTISARFVKLSVGGGPVDRCQAQAVPHEGRDGLLSHLARTPCSYLRAARRTATEGREAARVASHTPALAVTAPTTRPP